MKKRIKVGDVVIDKITGEIAVIIKEGVVWTDSDGQVHEWDFEILSGSVTSFADLDELEIP